MSEKTKSYPAPWIVAVALVASLAAHLVAAHEVIVEPVRRADGTRSVRPAVVGGAHLEAAPASLGFGEVTVGNAVTRSVSLTNVSQRQVSFTAAAAGPFTFSPPGPFNLAPGQSTQIDVTLQSASPLTLSHELALAVSHAGVTWAFPEAVPLVGYVGQPPALQVTSVTEVGFDSATNRIDLGFLAATPTSYAAAPSFAVTVTNTGGLTAHNVSLGPPGPGGSTTERSCHDAAQVTICVQSAAGSAPSSLGDLAPGASLTTVWSTLPYEAGVFDRGPFLLRADDAASVDLRVVGEVVPFELPDGLDFLLPAKFGQLTAKFSQSTDPLGDDPLSELRVTGFDSRTAFSLGEVDSVDLRTGNLSLVIPIGGEQQVRGPLAYSLNAVYNSSLWYRKTLAEYEVEPKPRPKPISGLWPDAAFNLVGGWSFHLGRLLPPRNFDGQDPVRCFAADPLAFEDAVDTGPRFVFIDPAGGRHDFWRQLHGNDVDPGDRTPVAYGALSVYYTRDGSLLRLKKEGNDVLWVEEPNGLRRRFQRRGTGSPAVTSATLPDEWLLTRVVDPYDNRIDVVYDEPYLGQPAWRIRDAEGSGQTAWREVIVSFTDWQGRDVAEPLLVDAVILPGFAGGTDRVYDFQYLGGATPTSLALDREHRSAFHSHARLHCEAQGRSLDTKARVPRLDRIVQPDGSAWAFAYDTTFSLGNDDLRLSALTLPTGGTIDYEYAFARDSAASCGQSPGPRDRLGVARRTVSDVGGGTTLEDVRYLRLLKKTADVPDNVCEAHPGLYGFSRQKPYSQQVVGVWSHFATAVGDLTSPATNHSTLTLHHFNVWPYNDACPSTPQCPAGGSCCAGQRMTSGRTYVERNTMTDPARQNGGLSISTETYDCERSLAVHPGNDTGVDHQGDRIDLLTADPACMLRRETWADFEVSRAGLCRDEFDMYCLLDSRLKSEKTVYHDDGDKWVRTDRSDYDGLGHYRKEVTTTSAWGPVSVPKRTTFQNYNPAAGTLSLDSQHRVVGNISLPAVWILDSYNFQWMEEGGVYRGGEACFDPALGHLEYERMWTCEAPGYTCAGAADGDGTLTDVRSSTDLVVRHLVNGQGELTRSRNFGADTLPAGGVPTGDDWCSDSHWGGADGGEDVWAASHQDYTLRREYDHGFLARRFVVGDASKELDRVVDAATGWTVSESLDSGEVKSFVYDPLGRVRWITSGLSAGRRYQYTQPAGGGWQVVETVYGKDVTPANVAGKQPIRSITLTYDSLGRPAGETLPTYDGGTATRSRSYHPGGQLRSISSLDDAAKKRKLEYDYAGRLLRRVDYDGVSTSVGQYAGIRRADAVTCVDVGEGATSSGICTSGLAKAEAKIDRDPFGRVLRSESAEGVVTTFSYDPADRQISAKRSDGAGIDQVTQTRTWTYDGRGFLRKENIPERDVQTHFSNFNTRGQPRTVEEKEKGNGTLKRTSTLAYDLVGRPLSVSVAGSPVKAFSYFTTGSGKGQLWIATRYNRRIGEASGVWDPIAKVWKDGVWEVVSTFGYDTAGRRNSRETKVSWIPDIGGDSGDTIFNQGWAYDDLDNVVSISYPETSNCTSCPSARTVVPRYSQGYFLTRVDDDAVAATSTLGASSISYHKSGLPCRVVHDQGGTDVYGVAGGMPRIASIDLANGSTLQRNLGAVTYDWAGNLRNLGGDLFDYDLDSRLIRATVGATTFDYGYDHFDNFLSTVDKGTIDRANNRLKGGVVYDPYGNLTSAGGGNFSLIYDEVDKVAQITQPDGVIRRNVYDHDDLRVMTQVGGSSVTLHWTLRDGGQVLRDFVGSSPHLVLEREYVYAGGRLLASQSHGRVETYHLDQVGSPRLVSYSPPLTDGSTRKLVDYGPFDEPLTDSGIPAGGFQGHEDDDAFTTYMRGRQFDRVGGRFLQVDPGRDGWSQYAYVGNNPLRRVDKTGLAGDEVTKYKYIDDRFATSVKLGQMDPGGGADPVGLVEIRLLPELGFELGKLAGVSVGFPAFGVVNIPGEEVLGLSNKVISKQQRFAIEGNLTVAGQTASLTLLGERDQIIDKASGKVLGAADRTSLEGTTSGGVEIPGTQAKLGQKGETQFVSVSLLVVTINIPLPKSDANRVLVRQKEKE